MKQSQSQMEIEAREAPVKIAAQLAENHSVLQALSERLRRKKPVFAMTIARGSSDRASLFAKYLIETQSGIVTASAAPSIVTLYNATLALENSLVIGISQSGQSPDIAEMFSYARKKNAITVAFVNETNSPLAAAAEYVVPLHAGVEKSVAATKSYLATLSALIQFVALFSQDATLQTALQKLPEKLQQATMMDWSAALPVFQSVQSALIIGRGFSFPIAQEAALKFKETAKLHAEAFSGADFMHGPLALLQAGLPILLFAQQDATLTSINEVAERIKKIGAKILVASTAEQADLALPSSLHPVCDPLMMIQAFYLMAEKLSVLRGFNPDDPLYLSKVTKTW